MNIEILKEYLYYDPDTGDFIWLKDKSNIKAGTVAGYIMSSGYRYISFNNKKYYAHRLIWFYMTGNFPDSDIDHINGNRNDNRWINLRKATRSENQQNRIGNKLTGATWHTKMSKWRATIVVKGKHYHLGYFDSAEDAANAYRIAKLKYHSFQPKLRKQ